MMCTNDLRQHAKRKSYLCSLLISFATLGVLSSCQPDHIKNTYKPQSLMGQGYGLHALTLAVEDMDSIVSYYSNVLGFTRPQTASYQEGYREGIKSTMFTLADQSRIEFLSVDDSIAVETGASFIRDFISKNGGALSYSISSSSLDQTRGRLEAQGFLLDSVNTYKERNNYPQSSKWDDGTISLSTLSFKNGPTQSYRPNFLWLKDFPYNRMHEWRSFYVMQRGFRRHPNGVVGTASLKIVVSDIDSARNDFLKMGLPEVMAEPSPGIVRFKLKRNQELHLIAPQSPDDPSAQFLDDYGPGVYAMVFEVGNLQETHKFLKANLAEEALYFDTLSNHLIIKREYAKGIQLEFKEEPKEQAELVQKLNLNFGGKLDSAARDYASSMYIKYCALCHGENRAGYAADNAPSLRSHSLMASAQNSNFLRYTIQYGRANTAMAGYYSEQGGPLELVEVELILKWLQELSGVEEAVELSRDPVVGDVALGSTIYADYCASCHGEEGEGISAPALGNPMLLATATDDFLRYAIREGRDSTPMPAFKDSLSEIEIDAVTAFLRSRASGWELPSSTDTLISPLPEDYVLNPDKQDPDFDLRDGLYLSAVQLKQALEDSMRLVLLDARSEVAWRQTHIPGAIPVPYYEEPEAFVEDIPNDSTWVVAYCACPHAASGEVIKTLRDFGFKNTAILDEGILVWAQLGYPVLHGN